MTYTVTVEKEAQRLHRVRVRVLDDAGNEVLTGETRVATDDPQEAHDYGERIFLPDLRNCFPFDLAGLVFPWEQEPEQEPEPEQEQEQEQEPEQEQEQEPEQEQEQGGEAV